MLRILVVDDSTLYRKVIRDSLCTMPNVEVIGVAQNGKVALERVALHQPDLITLDVEMPELTGLQVLEQLRALRSNTGVIMLSSLTDRGAYATNQALALGAFDFVLKPNERSLEENIDKLRSRLQPCVAAFAASHRRTFSRGGSESFAYPSALGQSTKANVCETPGADCCNQPLFFSPSIPPNPKTKPEAVAIGISTGGPAALSSLIPSLPQHLSVPIFVVQHMPPVFTKSLAESLNQKSQLAVVEAENGMQVQPGTVYIAPGGHQMKVHRKGFHVEIEINDDPPQNSSRPSVDYTFRSVAETYNSRTLGVIMTGMGADGVHGCRDIKRAGGSIITQDESSCVVYGMPRSVAEAGLSDSVCSLSAIGPRIVELLAKGGVLCS